MVHCGLSNIGTATPLQLNKESYIHSFTAPHFHALQLPQHLSRCTQTLAVAVNRRNQAPIDFRKLPLQRFHILIMFVPPSRRLIALHHLNLMRAVLPCWHGEIGCGAPGWQAWRDLRARRGRGLGGVRLKGRLLVRVWVVRVLRIRRIRLRWRWLISLSLPPTCFVLGAVVSPLAWWVGAQWLLVRRWAGRWCIAASVALLLRVGVVRLRLVLVCRIWVRVRVALGVAAGFIGPRVVVGRHGV